MKTPATTVGLPSESELFPGPTATATLDFAMIEAAHRRLRGIVRETPCVEACELSAATGMRVFLKRDHLQVTGSFKERGAANALACLDADARGRGVVAASAGNHALGLARHGARLGVPVTLVMPVGAARTKVERCRALGAEIVLVGATFDESDTHARALAASTGRAYVHPFDDPDVMAGQGTLGLEVLAQVSRLDAIVVPVGGGGLLAGVATAVKSLRPEVQVIAVEPAAAPSYAAAWEHGEPTAVAVRPTLADGLAVARVGRRTWAVTRGLVDAVVSVTEDEIALAMLRLFELDRTAIEGAGATALAALLAGKLDWLAGASVAVPVGGANVDASTFVEALQRGLALRACPRVSDRTRSDRREIQLL